MALVMASSIPRFIGIARDQNKKDDMGLPLNRYAQYVVEDGPARGFITFGTDTDEGVWSPYAIFEVERARSGDGELVHLKNTYNQKYLRKARMNVSSGFIAATADSHDEDRSKWSCTLFKITRTNAGLYKFQLLFNNKEWNIITRIMSVESSVFNDWFYIDHGVTSSTAPDYPNTFNFVDFDSLAVLPRFVAFKADNDRYLEITTNNNTQYSTFTGNDKMDKAAQFEIVTRRDENILIRPYMFKDRDTFLSAPPLSNPASVSLFQVSNGKDISGLVCPIKLDVNKEEDYMLIALKHYRTEKYCKRYSGSILHSFSPIGDELDRHGRIKVEDLVRKRELYNPQFHFADSKIYQPSPITIMTKDIVNQSNESTQATELGFSYPEFERNTYNTLHSGQTGLSLNPSISARLPIFRFIGAEASKSLELGYQGQHTVGKAEETTSQVDTKFSVSVPPMTSSKVSMIVSRAKIHVPYSYTQRDTLLDWTVITTRMFGGIFEGENTHVNYEIEEQKIT